MKDKPKTKKFKEAKKLKTGLDIKINLLSKAAKQLQVVGLLIFFLSLPLAFSLMIPQGQGMMMYLLEPTASPETSAYEISLCQKAGGEWRQFPKSCADWCPTLTQKTKCEQVITKSCDCGIDKCWDGEKCVTESKP